jgi:hypothetical protein
MKSKAKVKDYAICFVDILGYKNLLDELGENEFLQIIENTFDKIEKDINFSIRTKRIHSEYIPLPSVEYHIFSDNILFFTEIDGLSQIEKENYLAYLMSFIAETQNNLLREGILLRGGLTVGKLYYKQGKYIYGSGLMRAYELESTVANYPRIIIDPEIIADFLYNNILNTTLVTLDYAADFYFIDYFRCALLASPDSDSPDDFQSNVLRNISLVHVSDFPKKLEWVKQEAKKNSNNLSVSVKYRWLEKHLEEVIRAWVR